MELFRALDHLKSDLLICSTADAKRDIRMKMILIDRRVSNQTAQRQNL